MTNEKLSFIKAYFISLFSALCGKSVRKWKVFYLGETGIRKISYMEGCFEPLSTVFYRAENVPGKEKVKGNINDAYAIIEFDQENLVAIYQKIID